jgi:L-ascorbate metabolism protein UlaG (beta-lactamase superfamily)
MATHDIWYPGTTDPVAARTGSVLFIGTATVLIQVGGFTLLTDPNFLHAGDHAHLGYGLTSRRLTDPAVELDELPVLDACVLSHLHGDHWDRVAEEGLPKRLPILTTRHAARKLRRRGFREAIGLATWETARLRRGDAWLQVTSLPAVHAFGVAGLLLPPVMGSMLELGRGPDVRYRIYVSGDTLLDRDLLRIPQRWPDVDLGLFHLGGTRVLGVRVTMDAGRGLAAVRLIGPRLAIPIHFDDYPVFRSPLSDFKRAVNRAGLAAKARYLARGERYAFDLEPMAPEVWPPPALH